MDNRYTVYILTFADGRVYIGMTGQKLSMRCRRGAYQQCSRIGEAIDKFGMDAFDVGVVAEHLTKAEAERIEMENIARYDSTNPSKGFNVALGGNVVGRHSEVTRQKMSSSQRGRKFSEEHLTRLRKPKLDGAKRRTVLQYDENDKLLGEYGSVYVAADIVGGWAESIMRCCNHKQRTHKGYRWEYARRCSDD